MNRTLKEATINSFHYASHEELKKPLQTSLMAYTFAQRLKAIKGKTPWPFILNQETIYPEYFKLNANQFLVRLNNYKSWVYT